MLYGGVTDHKEDDCPDNACVIAFAISALNGQEIWSARLNSSDFSTPYPLNTVDNVVYYAAGERGFSALDRNSGSVIWQPNQAWGQYAIASNVLLVALPANGPINCAVNAFNGQLNWCISLGFSPAVKDNTNNAIVKNNMIYAVVPFSNYTGFWVSGISLANGNSLWLSDPISCDEDICVNGNPPNPVVIDDLVYLQQFMLAVNKIMVVSLTTGKVVVNSPTVERFSPTCPTVNGVFYCDNYLGLAAIDGMSGQVVWNFNLGDGYQQAALSASGIIYLAGGGLLYALDTATGKPLWTLPGLYPQYDGSSIAVRNNVVYIISGSIDYGTTLYAINAGVPLPKTPAPETQAPVTQIPTVQPPTPFLQIGSRHLSLSPFQALLTE